MKIKATLAVLLIISMTPGMFAGIVPREEAEKVARNFLYITHNKFLDPVSMTDIRLGDPFTYSVNGAPVFYAFDTKPGFILVSAEDAFTPVIGYAFTGSFDMINAPSHYKGFILNYADQIMHARQHNLSPAPEFQALWDELRSDRAIAGPINRERDVTPLLSNTWDQGQPYNVLCPEDPAGPGGHVWVGCVATAMAQIMYYWRYPETGTNQHCYVPGNPSYGQQCANFAETNYRWEGMINSIDNKNPYPNAELQYHCAVSVNMNFSPNGSGSYSSLVPSRLNAFWRYNNAVYLEKQNYTTSAWINLLKGDIDLGYPIYYSGYSPSDGGHAFVCDGYQGDNFHFNFGWSGSGNGYYSLSNVGGFYQGQACVKNFIPSDAAYPYHVTGNVTLTEKSGSFTDGSGPVADYQNNLNASWLIDPQTVYDSIKNITLNFPQFDVLPGDTIKVFDGGTTDATVLGAFSGATSPVQLTSSGNKLLIVFTSDASGAGSGFYAEYSTTSPVWCSGMTQFTEPTGTFDDGSGNFYYQSGATCMYRINPPYASKITLTFNYFETEEGADKLRIFDGSTQIGEFSGTTVPGPLTANSGTMTLAWSTNQYNNMQGWEVYYEVDNVGVDEQAGITGLEVYPNPANKEMNLSFTLIENGPLVIGIYSISGKQVYAEQHSSFSGQYLNKLDVDRFPAGIYFLRVSSATGTWNKKIIIE